MRGQASPQAGSGLLSCSLSLPTAGAAVASHISPPPGLSFRIPFKSGKTEMQDNNLELHPLQCSIDSVYFLFSLLAVSSFETLKYIAERYLKM